MKKYPRLYSLSTIGIIHHHENDYLFHSERTDFMGDSGSGKSIIADLLQLIFVGSSAYKSATGSLEERRNPDGLVLTTPGKGINVAYAFLNIEMSDEQYVTIGAYFESASKYTKPFIIQSSTDIENGKLVPMSIPLKATDFKDDNAIRDLGELEEVMDEKKLVFKKWERINPYHRVLYDNGILPLDLASNDKILNDYAKIIQSFSRAKTLDTQKSKSLIDFLFGQEKGKELYGKYIQVAKELESTIHSYGQNLKSIELLTRKSKKICSLKVLLDAKNSKEKEYLTDEILFHRKEYGCLSNSILTNTEKILTATYCLQQLVNTAKIDVDYAQKIGSEINRGVDNALDCYTNAKQTSDILESAQKLLENLNIEEQSLETIYQNYQKGKNEYILLEELQTKLTHQNLTAFFEQSEWQKGMQIGSEYFGKRINEIKSNLEYLELLSEYTDINNPDSLVRWAISLNRPLTKIEESLLMRFQTLKRKEPENPIVQKQYLPFPEILFENLKVEERCNGFWIDLGGIWEYIEYVPEQRFHTTDKEIINQYFENQNQDIEQQKSNLENERVNLQGLNSILSNISNANYAIEIYLRKEELKDFIEIPQLNISKEKIQDYLSALKQKETVVQEYNQSKQKYDDALAKQNENKTILEKLPAKITKVENELQSIETEKVLLTSISEQFSVNQASDYNLDFYLDSDDKVDTFQTEFNIQKECIGIIDDLKNEKNRFDFIKIELNKKETNFQLFYNELPDERNEKTLITEQQVQEKYNQYTNANAEYNAKFNSIVQNFIPGESHKFEGESKDFTDLVVHLLPDIFGSEKVIEEDVVNRIENHLKQINDKNRDLNSKKIRKIGDLLDDVQAAVGAQSDTVRKINRFFNDGEKRISGNYKLNLSKTESKEFPLTWLSEFKKKTSEQFDLFETSIADKMSAVVSIEEKIKESFSELTGNRNPDIGIKDLLNPNSYMELNLTMIDANNKSNTGSTGQTYAAIALLCIARLSIVGNKKRNEKANGIRFMPIDEAEGLGSNFDMLSEIAQKHDYQIITFAINPLGSYDGQFIYMLHRNQEANANINYTPVAIYSKADIKESRNG
jgi:hypothetical protein